MIELLLLLAATIILSILITNTLNISNYTKPTYSELQDMKTTIARYTSDINAELRDSPSDEMRAILLEHKKVLRFMYHLCSVKNPNGDDIAMEVDKSKDMFYRRKKQLKLEK